MAIIPLKQTVTIRRPGVQNEWGESTATTFTLKCRFEDSNKLTRRTTYQSGFPAIMAEEVVTVAQITFDKFADVRLNDEILYTDESGMQRLYLPLNIERIRGLNGKPLLTVVSV
ncbi:hypothetical protein [Peribacillus huizhouensis]|uniref:Phage head-tail adapter protein n=1 Tax=Peribacillus huizhouensis TaxID=1501239 RepID=A0ABR6CRH2_9BACI|nr:hypothetical protein [Peribacillus huizhouensis]MBA9027521.1 hypothetical protein [Peribacillus huizhouensis]